MGPRSLLGHASQVNFVTNSVMYTHDHERLNIKLDVSLVCFASFKNVLVHKKLVFASRE